MNRKILSALTTIVTIAAMSPVYAQSAAPPAAAAEPLSPAQLAFTKHELPKSFSTEMAAKATCKTPVIWADTKERLYYQPGSRNFGATNPGVYACVKDAIKAGYHPENG